jgi:hypothetical protein
MPTADMHPTNAEQWVHIAHTTTSCGGRHTIARNAMCKHITILVVGKIPPSPPKIKIIQCVNFKTVLAEKKKKIIFFFQPVRTKIKGA